MAHKPPTEVGPKRAKPSNVEPTPDFFVATKAVTWNQVIKAIETVAKDPGPDSPAKRQAALVARGLAKDAGLGG